MANPFALPMARRSLRNLFARPATRRYPFEVRPPFDGARGTIEFDLGSCVFCNLCARRCPAVAITCSREERYFAIDQLRCIACGVCADVCNKGSLTMSSQRRGVHAVNETGAGRERPGLEEWHGLQLLKTAPAARAASAGSTAPGAPAAE